MTARNRCMRFASWHHGMTEIGLHAVFRAVVVSRLTYASHARSGFTTATDRQRVDAFLRRSKRCGFYPPDLPDFDQLLQEADNPHSTNYFHLNRQRHRSINSDVASMTDNCMNTIEHLSDCITLLRGYCTKIFEPPFGDLGER